VPVTLLILKTLFRRIALPLVVLLMWAPAAYAWSWPVRGAVLQPFAYDESHPYASGQHRGIDIGADAAGEAVLAPASGTVSFVGSVPTSGECVTIQTSDGYSVTLTHLGTLLVAKGASVVEGQNVATIGPSGTAEFDRPYVHLGIRTSSDPNGYLDPLTFLPTQAPPPSTPAQSEPAPVQQPSTSSSASATTPAQPPAPAATATPSAPPSVSTTRGSTVAPRASRVSHHERPRVQRPHADARTARAAERPASRQVTRSHRLRLQPRHAPAPTRTVQRPVVEATAPARPSGLDAGHEIRPSAPVRRPRAISHSVASPLPLALNGAAALVALAAAFATRRRRKSPTTPNQVLRLSRPVPLRRAA
jgi:MYXO-CTERM domain-containing protein